jgi:hypothetical protein
MTAREKYLLSKYGITLAQYDKILKDQGGGCALCGKTPEEEGKNLAVDHCHKPPFEVRGILCQYHNHRVVGRHTDSNLLRRVADYLDQGTGFFVPKKKRKKRGKRKVRRN